MTGFVLTDAMFLDGAIIPGASALRGYAPNSNPTPFGLVAHVAAQTASETASVTTGAIDTTGASLLVMVTTWFQAEPTVSDSKGNTWTALAEEPSGAGTSGRIRYVVNPTVGSGHTFTLTASGTVRNVALCVAAFEGAKLTSPFDQQSEATATTAGPFGTVAVIPTEDHEVVVMGLTDAWAGVPSIDIGTITDALPLAPAVALAVGMAYFFQETAGSVQPAWSWTGGSARVEALIATFKASS